MNIDQLREALLNGGFPLGEDDFSFTALNRGAYWVRYVDLQGKVIEEEVVVLVDNNGFLVARKVLPKRNNWCYRTTTGHEETKRV